MSDKVIGGFENLLNEQKQEIARLTAEVERLQAAIDTTGKHWLEAELKISKLQAVVDAARVCADRWRNSLDYEREIIALDDALLVLDGEP